MLTAERGAAFGLRIALLLVPPIHDMLAAALTRSALMAVEAALGRGGLPGLKEFPGKIPVWRRASHPSLGLSFFLSFFLSGGVPVSLFLFCAGLAQVGIHRANKKN